VPFRLVIFLLDILVLTGVAWRLAILDGADRPHEAPLRLDYPERGSDSGLVTRAAFKAVRLQVNPWDGGFDSHPLPPTSPATETA